MDPQGKRKQGRLKATWRSTVEKEIKVIDLTWGEAEMAALDRSDWRQRVETYEQDLPVLVSFALASSLSRL